MIRVGHMRLPPGSLSLGALPGFPGIPTGEELVAAFKDGVDYAADKFSASAKGIIDYGAERASAIVDKQVKRAVVGHIAGVILSALVFSAVVSWAASPAAKKRISRSKVQA